MKVFYEICDESMGHAGRAYALIERLLKDGHKVDVYTFGQAHESFRLSDFPSDKLHEIEGACLPTASMVLTCLVVFQPSLVHATLSTQLQFHCNRRN